ncbi:hypothetical protein MC7420_2098 [Coleofasciculus chthonoplastes PCC 7420]|uniref:Uncharacterized protein n=1 Tax=Coleofasciculus chthonoplastes PCC 7420 TaxID=118168 RepID=B4VS94_9CYAN|nr:hypothetical protein MC7420_2098 [Coleofasciculus chthonoplastes PCC 7420]
MTSKQGTRVMNNKNHLVLPEIMYPCSVQVTDYEQLSQVSF